MMRNTTSFMHRPAKSDETCSLSSKYLAKGDPTAQFSARLSTIADLAVQLNTLDVETERYPLEQTAALERELDRVAVRFDRACAQALRLGVPLNTEFLIVNRAGQRYILSLTVNGVEYRAIS